MAPQLHADLTTRERVTLQTGSAECMSCHRTINPLGFAFENFDAVGKFRAEDRGKPVDSSAVLQRGDQEIELSDARQLARFVIDDPECQAAFCEQLFHFLVGQSINACGPDTRQHLRRAFVENDFNIRRLAEEIMVVSAALGHNTDSANSQ